MMNVSPPETSRAHPKPARIPNDGSYPPVWTFVGAASQKEMSIRRPAAVSVAAAADGSAEGPEGRWACMSLAAAGQRLSCFRSDLVSLVPPVLPPKTDDVLRQLGCAIQPSRSALRYDGPTWEAGMHVSRWQWTTHWPGRFDPVQRL